MARSIHVGLKKPNISLCYNKRTSRVTRSKQKCTGSRTIPRQRSRQNCQKTTKLTRAPAGTNRSDDKYKAAKVKKDGCPKSHAASRKKYPRNKTCALKEKKHGNTNSQAERHRRRNCTGTYHEKRSRMTGAEPLVESPNQQFSI